MIYEQNENLETTVETINNDKWVAKLMGQRIVTVPNIGIDGMVVSSCPVKTLQSDWSCPYCNQEMGEPQQVPFLYNNITYTIDVWTNKCCHVVTL